MLSRRRFLQTGSLVSLSPLLPGILGNTARATTAAAESSVLVVIQLDGGNDGLNTVVPYANDDYGRARAKLRLESGNLHKLNDQIALHESMRGAKQLFDEGRLCIVQGVGYPNPDRSHFRSMKIWQTASFDDDRHDSLGWLGSALDQRALQHPANAGVSAVYVGQQETPVALWGRRSTATSLTAADDLKLTLGSAASLPNSLKQDASLQQFVTKQVVSAYAAADELEHRQSGNVASAGKDYPNTSLGSHLKLISQLLKSGAPSRVYYTMQDGYDTHSVQLDTHYQLLQELSDAIKSFVDDLKAAKLDDRVVILAFSEFGRRVKENDSQGTDHGTAGPVFLAGSPVKGGLVGEAPDLTNLDDGDLKMQIDFRQVYAAVLDNWLQVDSKTVLEETFEKPALFSS